MVAENIEVITMLITAITADMTFTIDALLILSMCPPMAKVPATKLSAILSLAYGGNALVQVIVHESLALIYRI
jgi:hypothetical protein